MAMEDNVSQIENNSEENSSEHIVSADLSYELRLQYRLARKKLSSFLRNRFKKNFTEILFITVETPPTDYITALQKQYPDKVIKVLIPLLNDDDKNLEKTGITTDYFFQGKMNSAALYSIKANSDNIQVYGVYTKEFSQIEKEQDFYNFKYLSRYAKIARKIALKIKPDIIHAYNVPFLTGLELGNRWFSGYPIKYIQSVHHYDLLQNVEPFIAAVTFANKNEMKKICNDKVIKSSIAAIFNTEAPKSIKKTMSYINYILKKYDEYRKNVDKNDDTKENVILRRMNERILKIFSGIKYKNEKMYNPIYFSMKQASKKVVCTDCGNKPEWTNDVSDILSLPVKNNCQKEQKIHDLFNADNFRDIRFLNKKYILREFSQKRIELKFFDISIFDEEDVVVRGYLDSYFKVPMFIVIINENTNQDDIKTATLAILKAFEEGKNIQVIYNFPKGINNTYLNTLFDFFESQRLLNGKWVALEGKINMPQFLSAADMILIPSGNCLKIENIFYNALKYGCIPLISRECFTNTGVLDIFEDLNTGCVFKTNPNPEEGYTEYESLILKALDLYTNNNTSWNLIVENAMNYNGNWDFETLEKYNNLYNDLT